MGLSLHDLSMVVIADEGLCKCNDVYAIPLWKCEYAQSHVLILVLVTWSFGAYLGMGGRSEQPRRSEATLKQFQAISSYCSERHHN